MLRMDFKPVFIVAILLVSVLQVSGNDIKTLYTNGLEYGQYFPLIGNLAGENILRFSVRTSRDARILLANSPRTDKPVYEIVLGARNNTINFIQGRYPCYEEPSASTRTVNLLSENEFRNFWIKLKTNAKNTSITIQVGIEDEDKSFLEWRDYKPLNLQYLSFGSETLAHWKYGYNGEGSSVVVPKNERLAVVTMSKNGGEYSQYHPLSEVISHSDNDAMILYFTVRTSEEFQILFSPTASFSGDRYEFGLKRNEAYMNRRWSNSQMPSYTKTFAEDGIANETQKLRYWIKLTKDGQMTMGKGGSVDPFIFWHDSNSIFPQFVSFAVLRPNGEDFDPSIYADLEYSLGPSYTLDSQDCKPRWKEAVDQRLPPGAVQGGYNDKTELYVCRALHSEFWTPGSFVPENDNKGQCYIPYGIGAHKKTQFQVLTGCRFTWVALIPSHDLDNAIPATEGTGNKISISRVYHKGQVLIGKVSADNVAYAAFDNQELPFTRFEVLFESGKN